MPLPGPFGDEQDNKLTMVSVMNDENYKSDFESDFDNDLDELDTLELINQTSLSLKPMLSETLSDKPETRRESIMTVLEDEDMQVHDSRLSFDPIPIGCIRKAIAQNKFKSLVEPPLEEVRFKGSARVSNG